MLAAACARHPSVAFFLIFKYFFPKIQKSFFLQFSGTTKAKISNFESKQHELHVYFLFSVFFQKNTKKILFHKHNFSGSTKCWNFKLCLWRACGRRSMRMQLLFFIYFLYLSQKYPKCNFCIDKFSSAASLQHGSCAKDPVISSHLYVISCQLIQFCSYLESHKCEINTLDWLVYTTN